MKLRKLLCLFMALSLVFCLFGCSRLFEKGIKATEPEALVDATRENSATEAPLETEAPQETEPPKTESSVRPLLYKVTDDKGNTLWLFGSIHVGYDSFYPLPQYVYDAFDQSDAAAFEIDMRAFEKDMNAQIEALSQLVYLDGTTIKDHIDPELYTKAVEILTEYDYYNRAYDAYCPAMWESLFSQIMVEESQLDSNLGVDYHLLDRAYENGKQIQEVESALFQYGMMADFSPQLQEFLLESSVAYFDDLDTATAELEELVHLWCSGDEKAFADYLAAEDDDIEDPTERALYEEYNKAMVVDRNLSMTDFAEDALASGEEVFICVGAAHIVGDGAMAQLLAERGYTVTLVK